MSTGSASIPLLKAAPEPEQVAERLEGGDWPGMELALLPRHVADDAALDRAIAAVKDTVGVTVDCEIVDPDTLERSVGKLQRIKDRRRP